MAPFFPRADAAVLASKREAAPHPPQVLQVLDHVNQDLPIRPWSATEEALYPAAIENFIPAPVPAKPEAVVDRYLRATLAPNESLRLGMLWYYTRGLQDDSEFLSGLQEKAYMAQDSTGWEYVVIGLLDLNYYIRLSTIGLPLSNLPRGETICAHTVIRPPGSVFLLPNLMEDWRFQENPFVELGGLRAYAGAPLRLQNESGDCVGLGSLCVASSTSKAPLTKVQHQTLVRLADWVVADMIQFSRARRQSERRRMADLLLTVQVQVDQTQSEEPVLRALKTIYTDEAIYLQPARTVNIEIDGRTVIPQADLTDGLWEDSEMIADFIASSNQKDFPLDRIVRLVATTCETSLGSSLLIVASRNFRLVFDDVDSWFLQSCGNILSQMWQKCLLQEVLSAKEKFIRGFSHQLRTPVHGILGSAELLAEELMALGQQRGGRAEMATLLDAGLASKLAESSVYLDSITTAGKDLISIINNMITLNRWADIAASKRQYAIHSIADIEASLASEIDQMMQRDSRLHASVFLNSNKPINACTFEVDSVLVCESVLPIVVNAIQYAPQPHGVVQLDISAHSQTRELVIDIKDLGHGIDSANWQRIFEPYEKLDPQSPGAGLGLTLANKFATLLHGSVTLVSSEVGLGSHFRASFLATEYKHKLIVPSPPEQQQLDKDKFDQKLDRFHKLASKIESISLCDYYSNFLINQGLDQTDSSSEDCLIIFDFVSDADEFSLLVAQIPHNCVAICLVAASDRDASLNTSYTNIVYLSSPFTSSKMLTALDEVRKRFSQIKTTFQFPSPSALTPPCTTTTTSTLINWTTTSQENIPTISKEMIPLSWSTPPSSLLVGTSQPVVLIVDDNTLNLRILQMYCKKRGMQFFSARDGLEAITIFSEQQTLATQEPNARIQLVLMDLQMPVCDGVEATRRIRELEKEMNWKRSTFFIVTGQDNSSDRETAKAMDVEEYFVKPVGMNLLDCAIKRHFQGL